MSGVVFMNLIGHTSWISKSQTTVALSTCELEYITLFKVTEEATLLRQLYHDISGYELEPTTIRFVDIAAQSVANSRTSSNHVKQLDIKYHYVRETIENKSVITS